MEWLSSRIDALQGKLDRLRSTKLLGIDAYFDAVDLALEAYTGEACAR